MKEALSGKLAARDWEAYFRKAKVRIDDLEACKSSKSRTIKIGLFLSPNVDRAVPIEFKGRTGKAVLRVVKDRAKEKRYFFEVTWDDQGAEARPQRAARSKRAKNPNAPAAKPKRGTNRSTKRPGKKAAKSSASDAKKARKNQRRVNDLDW